MKLIDVTTNVELVLPPDMLWEDEFLWSPVVSKLDYSLTGAAIIQSGVKQKGRPITLVGGDESMCWVQRSTVETLYSWLTPANRVMTFIPGYDGDTRTFSVVFRHHEKALEVSSVKGFPDYSAEEWFKIKLSLMEI